MHGLLSFTETSSGQLGQSCATVAQRGDKDVVILNKVKKKQILYCDCIPEGDNLETEVEKAY